MKCIMCYEDILNPVTAESKPTTEFVFCSCECYEEFVDWARKDGEEE